MHGHKLCRMIGHFRHSHFGFKNDTNPNLKRQEWHVGSGTCDCDCPTCAPIHGSEADGKTFFIVRNTPTGSQVARVEIVVDGSEGIAL